MMTEPTFAYVLLRDAEDLSDYGEVHGVFSTVERAQAGLPSWAGSVTWEHYETGNLPDDEWWSKPRGWTIEPHQIDWSENHDDE